ncbi:MAG: hypothetical protein DME69_05910 [Verrucomicrobia bacterium]|nr:MAG: hypothetical protein DME87_05520 [Verrucomicrobiota bacterium]PYJ79124.1 MAG: hypothetical protein DME69_05910 [Verrucomicrobiota bacterium]
MAYRPANSLSCKPWIKERWTLPAIQLSCLSRSSSLESSEMKLRNFSRAPIISGLSILIAALAL